MALQSMTGFARAAGECRDTVIVWELRSVNGRGLDARLRLPPGSERLEPAVRQAIQAGFSRGNIQAALSLSAAPGVTQKPAVNEALLAELAAYSRNLQEQHGLAPASADGLLALRGVIEFPDAITSDEEREALDATVLAVLAEAIEALASARAAEGAALGDLLGKQIAAIEELTRKAEADPSREPAAIRARLAEQVAQLLSASTQLDEARLHAEAAFLATKADIREEIDRLYTHVASGRSLLAGGGAVGRKLEFLAQEFNREANTLCSKSNASSVTAIGLELKAVVDQFREQVQNLE
ncbi:MAG: YicC family protein [Rhizobiaceae bacterium]|nr:YicC family protein [Rhizobiaceae bacterium]